jgi:hypothetical protein
VLWCGRSAGTQGAKDKETVGTVVEFAQAARRPGMCPAPCEQPWYGSCATTDERKRTPTEPSSGSK